MPPPAGPGGEGGGPAAGRGAGPAGRCRSDRQRRPAGGDDGPVRQPAGLPRQPGHRRGIPVGKHQPGGSRSVSPSPGGLTEALAWVVLRS